jgi:hypothetical protein
MLLDIQSFIDYISRNKEWIFSGIGIFAITGVLWFFRKLFFQRSTVDPERKTSKRDSKHPPSNHWEAIRPPNSKYKTVSKMVDSMPAGIQTIALEYSTDGHAHPLNLKGTIARAEIVFECQVNNPMKAITVGNEYAMNFLPAQFLVEARTTLEKYTLKKIQDNRSSIASEISDKLKTHFDKYGFTLIRVGIGAISKIK